MYTTTDVEARKRELEYKMWLWERYLSHWDSDSSLINTIRIYIYFIIHKWYVFSIIVISIIAILFLLLETSDAISKEISIGNWEIFKR